MAIRTHVIVRGAACFDSHGTDGQRNGGHDIVLKLHKTHIKGCYSTLLFYVDSS